MQGTRKTDSKGVDQRVAGLDVNFLKDHGYILYDNVLDPEIIGPVKQMLDNALSKSGIPTTPETAGQWVKEKSKLQRNRMFLDLVNQGKVKGLLKQLIGDTQETKSCQIAFRFPGEKVNDGVDYWHIDNYTEKDFERKSIPCDFTCLVGIYLSDNLSNDAGNFTVLPGSHHTVQSWSRKHGGYEHYEKNGSRLLKQHIKDIIPQTKGFQVKAGMGSVIVAHRMLYHTMGPNVTNDIRKVIWFRVSKSNPARTNPKNLDPGAFINIWKEWECVKPIDQRILNTYVDFKKQIKTIESLGYGYLSDCTRQYVELRIRPAVIHHGEPCKFASMVMVRYYFANKGIEVHTNGFISRAEHPHMATDIMKESMVGNTIDLLEAARYIQYLDFNTMICRWYPKPEPRELDELKANEGKEVKTNPCPDLDPGQRQNIGKTVGQTIGQSVGQSVGQSSG